MGASRFGSGIARKRCADRKDEEMVLGETLACILGRRPESHMPLQLLRGKTACARTLSNYGLY